MCDQLVIQSRSEDKLKLFIEDVFKNNRILINGKNGYYEVKIGVKYLKMDSKLHFIANDYENIAFQYGMNGYLINYDVNQINQNLSQQNLRMLKTFHISEYMKSINGMKPIHMKRAMMDFWDHVREKNKKSIFTQDLKRSVFYQTTINFLLKEYLNEHFIDQKHYASTSSIEKIERMLEKIADSKLVVLSKMKYQLALTMFE
jgi:hypothetical protein